MAIHRRFLYAGLFLVAIGGVLVAADITGVNEPWLREALRLWPVAIIVIGLAVVVRRSRLALPAGVLAAVAPGLLLGGSMVAGPGVAFSCTDLAPSSPTFAQGDALSPTGTVSIAGGCGTSTIRTVPGTRWEILAGSTDAREPEVLFDADAVWIESPARGGRQLVLGNRREDWDVTLPVTMESLALSSHANNMTVALPGASIRSLAVEADAAAVRIDATGATIDELSIQVDFGSATVLLPLTRHLTGMLAVNVGSLRLCQPAGGGMNVTFVGEGPREVTVAGTTWNAERWSDGNVLATNQIELTVESTFGAIEINPIGGC